MMNDPVRDEQALPYSSRGGQARDQKAPGDPWDDSPARDGWKESPSPLTSGFSAEELDVFRRCVRHDV